MLYLHLCPSKNSVRSRQSNLRDIEQTRAAGTCAGIKTEIIKKKLNANHSVLTVSGIFQKGENSRGFEIRRQVSHFSFYVLTFLRSDLEINLILRKRCRQFSAWPESGADNSLFIPCASLLREHVLCKMFIAFIFLVGQD